MLDDYHELSNKEAGVGAPLLTWAWLDSAPEVGLGRLTFTARHPKWKSGVEL